MIRPEPCQVIWYRMGINSVAFPLTVVKAPFTDVRCRTSSPAPRKPTSSSVVRLLKKRIRRVDNSASLPKRSAGKACTREGKLFRDEQDVHKVSDALHINDSSTTNEESVQDSTEQISSRSEGPDCQECSDVDYCKATETADLEVISRLPGTQESSTAKTTQDQLIDSIPREIPVYKILRTDSTCFTEATKTPISKQRSKRFTKRKKAKRKSVTSVNRIPTRGAHRKLGIKGTAQNSDCQMSKEQPVTSTQTSGNKYLQVEKLKATYDPKGSFSKDTQVLLLPNLTNTKNLKGYLNTNKVPPWKQKNEEKKVLKESPSVASRRQLLTNNFPADGRIVKIYLSESHSEMITGAPSAPPGTPTADQLKAVQYVHSLMDIKSQRAVKAKLTTIGNKIRMDEQRQKERAAQEEQKRAHQAFLQLRERQRAEIYALNKVMTELENSNFKKFMEQQQQDGASVRV